MAQLSNETRAAVAAAIAVAIGLAWTSSFAIAQTVGPKKSSQAAAKAEAGKDAAQQASEAARKAYAAGLSAYQTGKFDSAVQSLSTALRGGGLVPQEMARAMYTRGLAYHKQGKPAQAISDLTSALWLKNGLDPSERNDALAARSEAYRAAGIQESKVDGPRVAASGGAASSPPAASSGQSSSGSWVSRMFSRTPEAPAPAAVPTVAAAPAPAATSSSTGSRWFSPTPTDAPSLSSAVAPSASSQTSASLRETSVSSGGYGGVPANSEQPLSMAAAPDQAQAAPPNGSSGSSGGGFFRRIFGGSSSTPQQPQAQAQYQPAGQDALTTSSTSPQAAVSSWSATTEVSVHQPSNAAPARQRNIQTAALNGGAIGAMAPPPPAEKPAVFKGKFKMHIAAVRSRQEAETIAAKLQGQYGGSLGGRQVVVDESVIGSMGTFYRVRVAGYKNAEEPREICKTIKSSGFDCLVVTK